MRTFDFAPLFRSTVGFDRLANLLDTTGRLEEPGYPPYNIEKTGADTYRITMAVAGFAPEELSVVAQANSLTVTGKSQRDDDQVKYLHRGIAGRAFERRFDLADYIVVTGANVSNGLLSIELAREVPEAMKPRSIQIGSTQPGPAVIPNKAA